MKIVFCWGGISGYMASCWRELIKKDNVAIHVIAWNNANETNFNDETMHDIPCTLLNNNDQENFELIKKIILNQKPDVITISGWMSSSYKKIVKTQNFKKIPKILCMDTPWWSTPKQYVARIILKSYANLFNIAMVPGERAWQYALRLGFSQNQIYRGLYGVDYKKLSITFNERSKKEWPKRFLFIGRFELDKGFDILIEAYKIYRNKIENPWTLTVCGKGSLNHLITKYSEIENLGFIQPSQVIEIFKDSGVFILPSRFDPWPLAIVEACSAGLPIIATEVCGSSVELIHHLYNGYMIPSNNVAKLTQAMLQAHNNYKNLPKMGEYSKILARAYSAQEWANKWEDLIKTLSKESII